MAKSIGAAVAALLLTAAAPPVPVAPPGAFSLLSPADLSTNVSLLPTLTWGASSGAATYTLEVATDGGFTNIVLTQVGIVSTSYTPGAPVAQGVTFHWRVTALNAGGNTPAAAAFSFTTTAAPPGAFAQTAPADGATGVALQPTFTWGASTGAATYTLEVSTDPAFSSLAVSQPGLATTSFPLGTPLVGGVDYFWRVKAVNVGGTTTAMGAPLAFQTVTTGPGVFGLVFPPDQSTGVDPNTFFMWNDAPGVGTYTLDLATDSAFSSPVFEVTGIPGSSFSSTLNLTPFATYYWRVTAVNGSGSTMSVGAPFRFTVGDFTGSGGGGSGFSGSSGGCGLLGLELLLPFGAWRFARRRLRRE